MLYWWIKCLLTVWNTQAMKKRDKLESVVFHILLNYCYLHNDTFTALCKLIDWSQTSRASWNIVGSFQWVCMFREEKNYFWWKCHWLIYLFIYCSSRKTVLLYCSKTWRTFQNEKEKCLMTFKGVPPLFRNSGDIYRKWLFKGEACHFCPLLELNWFLF